MPVAWLDGSVIWTGAAALTGTVFVLYFAAFAHRNRRDRRRLAEAQRLGIEQPVAQYPYVDAARCIGCGTCVKACPEGDVLGIVGGTAVVVNGLRCVGHAHCERACPVDAIRVGVGHLREREDIPLLDEWNEASVPGVFVAGELGGLALIRNAVEQGRRTVTRIAERADRVRAPGAVDVAVVGAGPAGLAAALAAVEHGLSCVVLEQAGDLGGTILHYPRRKLVLTEPVELPLGGWMKREEYQKEELLEIFTGVVGRHRLDVRFGNRVEDVRPHDGAFLVRGASDTVIAGSVVLALGRQGTPRRLGVPGEELPKVMYQLRDAESYKGRRILCVGGGDSAVEAAMGLARQGGNEVTISYRRETFARVKKKNQQALEKMLHRGRLRAVTPSKVLEIDPHRVQLEAEGKRQQLDNDDVFVMIGGEPALPLLRKLGVRFGGPEAPLTPKGLHPTAQGKRSATLGTRSEKDGTL